MPTRRALLATALAVGPAASTAGCTVPGRSRDGPSSLARTWVPDPATLQPSGHGKLFALDRRAVDAVRAALADGTYRKYRNYARFLDVGRLGVAPDDVADLVQVYPPASAPRRAAVVRAAVDADRLRERLATAYDRRARHRDVDVFWTADGDERSVGEEYSGNAAGDEANAEEDEANAAGEETNAGTGRDFDDPGPVEWGGRPVAVGVDDRHLVLGAPTPTLGARAVVERVVDARAGAATRYVEASAGLRPVLEALGGGDDVSASTYGRVGAADAAPEHARFAGAVATGHRYRFRGGTTRSRYAFAFAGSEGTAEGGATGGPATATVAAAATAETAVAAVRRWVDAHRDGRLFGAYRSTSVERRGRTVVVDGVVPTGAV